MSKFLIIAAFVLLSVSAVPFIEKELIQEYLNNGLQEIEHKIGARWFKGETEEGSLSVVHWPQNGALNEPEIIERIAHHFSQGHNPNHFDQHFNLSDAHLEGCTRGDLPDFWKFFGEFIVQLNSSNLQGSYSSPCFSENTFELNFIDETTVEVVHTANHHDKWFCDDGYFFSTMQNFHVSVVGSKGVHRTIFQNLSAFDMQVIQESGIFIYRYCDRVVNVIPDIFLTALMFLGGLGKNPDLPIIGTHPNLLQEELAKHFIHQASGYEWQERPKWDYVDLDKSLIKSGDYFTVIRFIGNDAAIEYGSGSRVGHATIALWVEDELYILESQGGAWPKQGIQMNPYDTWMQWAQNAGYMVTWLPLKPEWSAKFDAQAAYDWFLTVSGQPYGYEAFLWGWIDTVNASFPALMSNQYLASFFAFAESRIPAASKMFNPGVNFRLGTNDLSVAEMAVIIAERGLSFPDLYAIPEIDGTMYSGHYAYVCSAFVTAMYKAGGIFDGYTINAVEWTPRDIYQAEFIDPSPVVPDNCKEVDPTNPYCQVMGRWRMTFPGISTIPLYNNMNEHCPSLPPLYERTPGC